MYQVLIQEKSLENGVLFFQSKSIEDAIQVALNLHRACNVMHKISVFDVDSGLTRLNLFSEDYD